MKENKLIAEFMGLNTSDGVYYNHIVKEIDKQQSTLSLKKERFKSELTHFALLEYHTSWEWLIPVVQKMNTTELWDEHDISQEDGLVDLATYLVSGDKTSMYNVVVEFIKQLNKEV